MSRSKTGQGFIFYGTEEAFGIVAFMEGLEENIDSLVEV